MLRLPLVKYQHPTELEKYFSRKSNKFLPFQLIQIKILKKYIKILSFEGKGFTKSANSNYYNALQSMQEIGCAFLKSRSENCQWSVCVGGGEEEGCKCFLRRKVAGM